MAQGMKDGASGKKSYFCILSIRIIVSIDLLTESNQSVHLQISLSACRCVWLPLCLFVCLSYLSCPRLVLSVFLSVFLSVCRCVCLSGCFSVSVCLSVCVTICMCLFPCPDLNSFYFINKRASSEGQGNIRFWSCSHK